MLGQGVFQHGQWGATAHGDHQLTGLVVGDAAPGGGVEHLTLRRLAIKVLGAATPDTQRRAMGSGVADVVGDGLQGGVHGVHRSTLVAAPAQAAP